MHCTAGFFVSLWLVVSIALTAKNQYYLSMKIIDLLQSGRPTLSFEVFPPKTDAAYEPLLENVQDIAALHPDFMSVTYGAGGGTSKYTLDIARDIKERFGVKNVWFSFTHIILTDILESRWCTIVSIRDDHLILHNQGSHLAAYTI